MKIVAFDAATLTGYAIKHNGEWITGLIRPSAWHKLVLMIAWMKDEYDIDQAVIENCYMGVNVNGLKALQDAQTRIKCALEHHEIPYTLVYANTWQSSFGISGKRDDRKHAAKKIAKHLGANQNISQDEADAVCLADYAERIGKQEELQLKRGRK